MMCTYTMYLSFKFEVFILSAQRQRSEEGGELALLRFGTLILVLTAEPTLILSPIRVIEIHTGVNDSTNE